MVLLEVHAMQKLAETIRRHVEQEYVRPARNRGDRGFTVVAGDVHRALRLSNRIPPVCSALQTKRLLQDNHLRIVQRSGPPSGQSTTVAITYEFADSEETTGSAPDLAESLLRFRGALRDVFQALGGGEKFLREERAAWHEKQS